MEIGVKLHGIISIPENETKELQITPCYKVYDTNILNPIFKPFSYVGIVFPMSNDVIKLPG